jgi:hypothetical protein
MIRVLTRFCSDEGKVRRQRSKCRSKNISTTIAAGKRTRSCPGFAFAF